jgi:hypothetical protein
MEIEHDNRVQAYTETVNTHSVNGTHAAECRRAGIHDDYLRAFSGMYVISPDSSPVDQNGVWLFKVGRSRNYAVGLQTTQLTFHMAAGFIS